MRSFQFLNYALRHEGVWTCWGIPPPILSLWTRWMWVVRFMLRPLYSRWTNPLYPLNRRLGGPQSRFGRFREEKIFKAVVNTVMNLRVPYSMTNFWSGWGTGMLSRGALLHGVSKKVKPSLCLRGKWSTTSPFLFIPWKKSLYPLNRRLFGHQIVSGPFFLWRTENILLLPGLEHLAFHTLVYFL